MIAVRSSFSWKKHMEELQSCFNYLDRHFKRSYMEKKNRNVISYPPGEYQIDSSRLPCMR